jgi:hypothetical protein
MKTENNIGRAALACLAALSIGAAGVWASGNGHHGGPHSFEGAWLGVWEGPSELFGGTTRIEWVSTMVPTDASGRALTLSFEWLTVGKDFEALMTILDYHSSTVVGRAERIDRDSATFTLIFYGVSNELPREIRGIFVMTGEMAFVGPNKIATTATLKLYLTNSGVDLVAPIVGGPWPYGDADADHDLLPDPGAVPFNTTVYTEGVISRRLPLLP